MKPRLYRNDATEFNNLGFGVLTTAFFCEVTEQLNQAPTLELHLLNYDPLFQYVTTGNIIAVQPNNYDPVQAFIIEEVHKTIAEEVTVYATHIAAHRAKLIPVSAFTATTLNAALSALISHSMETNPLTLKKDSEKNNVTATMETTRPASLRELLGGSEGSIIDIYRGEWAYDNFTMTLYNKRGHDNGVRVMYRKNMTDFQLGELFDWAESVNGCIGFWQNEETTVTSAIQYAAGANDFPYKKTVVVDFTDKFEDPPTVAQLNELAAAWISGKGAPAINMDVTFDRLAFDDHKTITLGDTVQVINPELNINTTRRIVGLVYDTLAEEYTTITIGDQKETINEAIYEAAGTDSIDAVPYATVAGIAEKAHTSEVADSLKDSFNNSYRIQARYGGSGDNPSNLEWFPMYHNIDNHIIEMAPVSKYQFAKTCIRTYTATINWTLSSTGGVYAHQFNPFTLWGITAKHILNIGMAYYSGSWRYLNFYPYGDPTSGENSEQWVVISNQASLSGTIKIYYF